MQTVTRQAGMSCGVGFAISWQNGPLGRGKNRMPPNGAFTEGIVNAVIGRMEFYQSGKFACDDNAEILKYLWLAKAAMNRRTQGREKRGVEGTHAK